MATVDSKQKDPKPKRVFVTAESAKGRKLLYPIVVDYRIRQAQAASSETEARGIIIDLEKQSLEPMVHEVADSGEQVEMYEVDDEFWAWFKSEVAQLRKIEAVIQDCKNQMLQMLQAAANIHELPSLLEDDKRGEWEKKQLDVLGLLSEKVIGAKENDDIRGRLAARIANGQLAAQALREFTSGVDSRRLEKQVDGLDMSDTDGGGTF